MPDYAADDEDEEDLSSDEESTTDRDSGREYDLRYKAELAVANTTSNMSAEAKGPGSISEFDSDWLKAKVSKYVESNNTSSSLGLDEMTSTIYDVLNSQRRDDELQNEVGSNSFFLIILASYCSFKCCIILCQGLHIHP